MNEDRQLLGPLSVSILKELAAGSSAPAGSPALYRRLRWWERRQPGDEWLHWPTCEWVPAVHTSGMRALRQIIRRPKANSGMRGAS